MAIFGFIGNRPTFVDRSAIVLVGCLISGKKLYRKPEVQGQQTWWRDPNGTTSTPP
jgi:hypothetical protein